MDNNKYAVMEEPDGSHLDIVDSNGMSINDTELINADCAQVYCDIINFVWNHFGYEVTPSEVESLADTIIIQKSMENTPNQYHLD